MRRDRVPALLAAGMPFRGSGDGLELRAAADFAARTTALADAVDRLARDGLVRKAIGEPYPVAPRVRETPLCTVDRAAVAFFGIAAAGVHMNGFVRRADGGIELWIAERAHDKPTYPGMLDNTVAGGQPHGLGIRENLVKECGEEAGIPPALAATARSVGTVGYVAEHDSGLKPDTMFCFDLELPDDFEPRCQDGEVGRFVRMPVAEVASIVAETRRFKFNCNLVVIDFLVRHGLLDADDPDYARVVSGLRHRGTV